MFNKIAHLEDRVAYVISRVIKQIGNRRELSRHSIKITHILHSFKFKTTSGHYKIAKHENNYILIIIRTSLSHYSII